MTFPKEFVKLFPIFWAITMREWLHHYESPLVENSTEFAEDQYLQGEISIA